MREPESLVFDVPCCVGFCCFFSVKCLVSSALKSPTPFELTALFVTAAILCDAECDGDSLGGDVRLVIAKNEYQTIMKLEHSKWLLNDKMVSHTMAYDNNT